MCLVTGVNAMERIKQLFLYAVVCWHQLSFFCCGVMLSTFVESLKQSGFDIAVPFCGMSVNGLFHVPVQTYNSLVQKRFHLPVMNQSNTLAMLIGIDVIVRQSQGIHACYGRYLSNISLTINMS